MEVFERIKDGQFYSLSTHDLSSFLPFLVSGLPKNPFFAELLSSYPEAQNVAVYAKVSLKEGYNISPNIKFETANAEVRVQWVYAELKKVLESSPAVLVRVTSRNGAFCTLHILIFLLSSLW